ncbi:hypothetical protein Glove_258g46 [Diversispora epigaea]|uniref:Uncharacterized protein n=1 Tax=Diversispora epigaea TaxID=1348612 RepID=A0A397I9A6_9GLOM|nr:hypothetical protein Glove_258g46 [Diversispora epigaea]
MNINDDQRARIIGTFAGFAGNANNMIGSGIYSAPGIVLQKVGSPVIAVMLWIVGGIANLFGSLSYVELGAMIREGGGEIAYLRDAFPTPYRLMSYLFSFSYIILVRPVSIAAVLQAVSNYLLFTFIEHPVKCNNAPPSMLSSCCEKWRILDRYLHPKEWSNEFWLSKAIGLSSLAVVTVYHMSSNLWTGIYSAPGIVLQKVGSPVIAVMLWIVGGIANLFGSLSYVELGAMIREGGGEIAYLRDAFPTPYRLMSYLFSFSYIILVRPVSIAAVLQAVSNYLLFTFIEHPVKCNNAPPSMLSSCCEKWRILDRYLHPKEWSNEFWLSKAIGLSSLAVVTVYHMSSNLWTVRINQTFAIIKITTLVVIIIIGFANFESKLGTDESIWSLGFDKTTPLTFASALIPIYFAYNGWNNLNFCLNEFENPEERLIYSNGLSVALVGLLYTLTNVALFSVVKRSDAIRAGKDFNEVLAGYFAKEIANDKLARVFSFLAVVSAFGAVSSMVWSGSRIIVAASVLNYVPFFSNIFNNWDRFNTPFYALLTQSLWCSILFILLGGAITSDAYLTLVEFSEYLEVLFYFITGISLLVLRCTVVSAFGAVSSMVWSGSRIIVAASVLNYVPFFSNIFNNWDRFNTPFYALLTQSLWCSILFILLGGAITSDAYLTLVEFSEYLEVLFYFITGISLLVLRCSMPGKTRPYRVWLIVPIIFVLVSLFILVGSGIHFNSAFSEDQEKSICIHPSPILIHEYWKIVAAFSSLLLGLINADLNKPLPPIPISEE